MITYPILNCNVGNLQMTWEENFEMMSKLQKTTYIYTYIHTVYIYMYNYVCIYIYEWFFHGTIIYNPFLEVIHACFLAVSGTSHRSTRMGFVGKGTRKSTHWSICSSISKCCPFSAIEVERYRNSPVMHPTTPEDRSWWRSLGKLKFQWIMIFPVDIKKNSCSPFFSRTQRMATGGKHV